jgi:hypothetical protein
MSELIADLFISVDGCAKGSRSPAYFGFGGPDLDRWIGDQMKRPQRHLMGRKTYEALAAPEPGHDGLAQPGSHAHHGVLTDPAGRFVAAGDDQRRLTGTVGG